MPFVATWMHLEIIILSEVKSDRKTNITWYCLYVESKKSGTNELILQNRNRLTDLENKLTVTEGQRMEG